MPWCVYFSWCCAALAACITSTTLQNCISNMTPPSLLAMKYHTLIRCHQSPFVSNLSSFSTPEFHRTQTPTNIPFSEFMKLHFLQKCCVRPTKINSACYETFMEHENLDNT